MWSCRVKPSATSPAASVSTQLAAVVNHLADPGKLRLGQRLVLSNRHIVPLVLQDGLVINVGDLMLYWMRDGDLVGAFPVGVGRVAWETPSGHCSIVSRRRDPVWHVPPKIQREMREKGEPVKRVVPPGPDNPLGKSWLQLSLPGYGIHGANAPRSVGKSTTPRLRPAAPGGRGAFVPRRLQRDGGGHHRTSPSSWPGWRVTRCSWKHIRTPRQSTLPLSCNSCTNPRWRESLISRRRSAPSTMPGVSPSTCRARRRAGRLNRPGPMLPTARDAEEALYGPQGLE